MSQTSLQVNCFEKKRREEIKNWAKKHDMSVRLLIYCLLDHKKEIDSVIKQKVAENVD